MYTKFPVVGFNSGKYDLPILRKSLFKQLGLVEQKGSFVIKKASTYVQLSTGEFVFLDLKNVPLGFPIIPFCSPLTLKTTGKAIFPMNGYRTSPNQMNHVCQIRKPSSPH